MALPYLPSTKLSQKRPHCWKWKDNIKIKLTAGERFIERVYSVKSKKFFHHQSNKVVPPPWILAILTMAEIYSRPSPQSFLSFFPFF
jgi:hypothetical protein